ncbi:13839_t:CDS:2 [Entrophospora sp. SA101]|nr:13839_t:CDS:2 [Entrophospora sp. SA101]CAJ0826299.1 11914_t:CDS:2 [Entrophospora sp. SA101]
MSYSLPSKDLIADSIKTIGDGINRPSLMVYGETIKPGQSTCVLGKLDIVSAFQVYGSYISDKINEEERLTL